MSSGMNSLQRLNVFPDFDLMNTAILLNLEEVDSDLEWSIQSLIYESLRTNLNLQAASKDVLIAAEDIKIAQSNLRPQADVSSSAVWIDPTRVDNSFGNAADLSWTANASINQLIYSEPALANVAIQKLTRDSENARLREVELDLILETAQAYLSYLEAKTLVKIRNQNVEVTSANLDISRSKERLGYTGISDVYRLESELAQNVIDLNDALSLLNQTRININRIINHPMDEEFLTVDVQQNDLVSIAGEPRMEGMVQNHLELARLTDFLVSETFRNSPELSQIDLALQSLNRLLLSNERRFYLPEVGLNGSWDQPIHYVGAAEPFPGTMGLTKDPQLTVGAKISLPILQGGYRKYQVQRNKVSISQLRDQEADLKNSLEAALRQSMEILSASFQKVDLSKSSAKSALENFKIIQDLYRQGEVEIITLIDAQNSVLAAELSANNAVYNFISNFLTVERVTGKFYFLMSTQEKDEFVTNMYNAIIGGNEGD